MRGITHLNILVISPHRDDAAFSCALSISYWLENGHKVTVLNLFTRSLYAPYSDAENVHANDRMSYVSAMRKREDVDFTRQVSKLEMIDLNLKDAPIRLRCSAESVCDLALDSADPAIAKIRKAVQGLAVGAKPFGAIVVPSGLGNHVDHRVAREACLPLAATLACALYEDLPYASRVDSASDVAAMERESDERSAVFCRPARLEPILWKRRMCLLYPSQIDMAEANAIADFSLRYEGGERLWANKAWLDMAKTNRLSLSE